MIIKRKKEIILRVLLELMLTYTTRMVKEGKIFLKHLIASCTKIWRAAYPCTRLY